MNLECILLVGLFGIENPEYSVFCILTSVCILQSVFCRLSFKVFQILSIISLNWMHSVFCWLGP